MRDYLIPTLPTFIAMVCKRPMVIKVYGSRHQRDRIVREYQLKALMLGRKAKRLDHKTIRII